MTDQRELIQPRPGVLRWFRAYVVLLCLAYIFCVALGFCFAFLPDVTARITPEEVSPATGWLLLIGGILFLVASGLPLFLMPKPWVWVYDLVVICSGMTGCLLPFCIPLLIFWIKPETKKFFGRTDV